MTTPNNLTPADLLAEASRVLTGSERWFRNEVAAYRNMFEGEEPNDDSGETIYFADKEKLDRFLGNLAQVAEALQVLSVHYALDKTGGAE